MTLSEEQTLCLRQTRNAVLCSAVANMGFLIMIVILVVFLIVFVNTVVTPAIQKIDSLAERTLAQIEEVRGDILKRNLLA